MTILFLLALLSIWVLPAAHAQKIQFAGCQQASPYAIVASHNYSSTLTPKLCASWCMTRHRAFDFHIGYYPWPGTAYTDENAFGTVPTCRCSTPGFQYQMRLTPNVCGTSKCADGAPRGDKADDRVMAMYKVLY